MQPLGVNYTAIAAVCVAFPDIHEELHDIATELKKAKSREPS
jgi:hypothetical protein